MHSCPSVSGPRTKPSDLSDRLPAPQNCQSSFLSFPRSSGCHLFPGFSIDQLGWWVDPSDPLTDAFEANQKKSGCCVFGGWWIYIAHRPILWGKLSENSNSAWTLQIFQMPVRDVCVLPFMRFATVSCRYEFFPRIEILLGSIYFCFFMAFYRLPKDS